MIVIYRLLISLYTFLVWCVAPFNPKAKKWIGGRKDLISKIRKQLDPSEKKTWFHFASLGEFEQGRPVLEAYRSAYPQRKIVITFFSPSGYEVRKDTPLADFVFYLPSDSARHAKALVDAVNPDQVFFTKYEYWYYYFRELNKRSIPLYIVSAIFRKDQLFFKTYGAFYRKILSYVTYFFVQDESSAVLLKNIGHTNLIVTGDTRFDRVYANSQSAKTFPAIKAFTANSDVLVAGSTWPRDEALLQSLGDTLPELKMIIAPHELSEGNIRSVENRFDKKTIRYSNMAQISDQHTVLIIDNIGMLSSLYQYAGITYIGGGFGKGIHNTLEPACFSKPVLFGPNYKKFREAADMIRLGAAFSVKDETELAGCVKKLMQKDQVYRTACENAGKYVYEHTGSTAMIMAYIQRSN